MELAERKCVPCSVGGPTLPTEEAERLLKEIPEWALKEKSIEREYKLDSFRDAIEFVNEIAVVAEQEDHHPDICIFYNKVKIELTTHKIGGLSINDFVLAAKIEKLS